MIRLLAKLLRVLNSETEPSQISLGFCLAMIAGLTPLVSLHNVLVLLLVLVIRVNLSAFVLGFVVFSGVAYVLDPLFHWLGLYILTEPALEGLWTTLYNSMLGRLERFHNSIVTGSLVFSLLVFGPLLLALNLLIHRYRQHVLAWVQKTKLMQIFQASRFYQAYQALSGFGGSS